MKVVMRSTKKEIEDFAGVPGNDNSGILQVGKIISMKERQKRYRITDIEYVFEKSTITDQRTKASIPVLALFDTIIHVDTVK